MIPKTHVFLLYYFVYSALAKRIMMVIQCFILLFVHMHIAIFPCPKDGDVSHFPPVCTATNHAIVFV